MTGPYARGLEALRRALEEAARANLAPPPRLTVSQWAERHAMLSPETSAQTGRFRAYAYQLAMMDAVNDPAVQEITVMKSARVGFTRVLDNIIGFFLHQDPSPILMVQPTVDHAEDYSRTEVEPMLRDTPVLAAIAGDLSRRDSRQTLLKRVFRNGTSISFVGANSPNGFRRITVRVVLFDEVDAYPTAGAGEEGDQIRLGIRRAETFWNRVVMAGSTPAIAGESRIERRWKASDQRRFFVPCPHCGERQFLEWGGAETPYGMKWRRDEAGRHLPETAYYLCRQGCVIEEEHKAAMVAAGEWRATAPFTGHAGFHIWTAYALHPNAAWAKLVAEWLGVKDHPLERQTFVNLTLGEPYQDFGDKALTETRLLAMREVWDAEVPDGVAVVTVGVDVQDDRAELEVVGWGRDEESWSLAHLVVEGDPDTEAFWDQVDALLRRSWHRADGRGFVAMAVCIDSGGHHTQRVYGFAKARLGRRVWAIKGEAAQGGARSPVWPTKRPSSKSRASFRPVIIGVNAAKDVVRSRLHLTREEGKPAPAGFMHFPVDRDLPFFQQLVAERLVVQEARGQRFRVWKQIPGRANEALDMRVYAYAALCGLIHFGLRLNKRAEDAAASLGAAAVPAPAPAAPSKPTPATPVTRPAASAGQVDGDRAARIARLVARIKR